MTSPERIKRNLELAKSVNGRASDYAVNKSAWWNGTIALTQAEWQEAMRQAWTAGYCTAKKDEEREDA